MKKIVAFFALSTISVFGFTQELDKDEIKEIKKEIKELSPAEFKQMKQDASNALTMEGENVELKEQLSSLEEENEDLKSELFELKGEVEELKQKQAEVAQQEEATDEKAYEEYGSPSSTSKGLVYKVQIGAFKSYDLRDYIGKHKNFSGEVDSDGTMKYTLGEFKEYWEADKLKQYLRKMGVKGAWVVAYKNGQRVDIKDALEGAL